MEKAPSASGRLSPTQWALLALVLIADVLDLMDSTIGNIAAPSIVADLGGGEALVKWLGAGYALAMGALLVLGGRLGDRFGRRPMFLIGLAGFTLASAACGLAANPTSLVVSRVVQGAFGALLLPQGLSLLMVGLSRDQLPTAFSLFGPVMGLSAVFGPIVAGFLISADLAGLGWRPVFLINVVLGGAAFLAAWNILPRDEERRPEALDVVGTVLLGLGLLGVFFGLIEGPFQGGAPALALGAGVVVLSAFVVRQLTARHPLILPSVFQNRGFTSGLLLGLVFFAAVNGLSYVSALFLQLDLGMAPLDASLAMAPLLLGIITASFAGRPLIATWGRRLVLVGLLATLAGAALLAWASGAHSPWPLVPGLFVLGCGMGACFSSIFDLALGNLAPEQSGSASGTLSAVQQLANAVGSAVVTGVYFQGSGGMVTTVVVVGTLVAVCLPLVPLLPNRAPEQPGQ